MNVWVCTTCVCVCVCVCVCGLVGGWVGVGGCFSRLLDPPRETTTQSCVARCVVCVCVCVCVRVSVPFGELL